MVSARDGAAIGRARIGAGAIGGQRRNASRPEQMVRFAGMVRVGSVGGGHAVRAEDSERVVRAG
jgi:hypothetical protein